VGIHLDSSSAGSTLPRLQDRTSVGLVPPFYALQVPLSRRAHCDRVHQHSRSLVTYSSHRPLVLALRHRVTVVALQRSSLLRINLTAVTSDSTCFLNDCSCWHRQARQHLPPSSHSSHYRLSRTHPQIPIYSGWTRRKLIADTVVTRSTLRDEGYSINKPSQ